MLPKKITMENFGPFKCETVDFEKMAHEALFLISGKTGAGKTTIFDAMTFALFGKTSGKLRDGKEMRSSFAQADQETSITFTFEHQGHHYKIIRKPEQELAKKKGTGTRNQTAKVCLTIYDQDNQEIKSYTKVKEVETVLQELLHLDCNQFTQIILLPQGDFREFLVANSNEKEVVLRNLFSTQLYQRLNDWLKEEVKNQNKEYEKTSLKIQQWLEELPLEFDEFDHASLEEKLTANQTALKVQEETLKIEKQEIISREQQQQKLQHELITAQELANDFTKKAQLEEEYALHQAQESAIIIKQTELELRQKAETLRPLADRVAEYQTKITVLQEQQTEVAAKFTALTAEKNIWQATEENYRKDSTYWQEQKDKQRRWRQLVPLVQEKKELQKQAETTGKQVEAAEELVKKIQISLTEKEVQQKALQKKAALEEVWQERRYQETTLAKLVETLENHQTKRQEGGTALVKLQQTEEELLSLVSEKEQELANQLTQVTLKKSEWAKVQIARLSLLLVEGEPCPVCGSAEHPDPAANKKTTQKEIAAAETALQKAEEAAEEAKLALQKTTLETEQVKTAITAQKALDKKNQQEISELKADLKTQFQELYQEKPENDLQQFFLEKTAETKEQLAELKKVKVELETLDYSLIQLKQQIDVEKNNQQTQIGQLQLIKGQLAVLVKQLEAVDDDLEIALNELEESLATHEEKLAAHRLQEQELEKTATILTEQQNYLMQDLTAAKTEYNSSQEKLRAELRLLDLTESTFHEMIEDNQKTALLLAEVTAYQDQKRLLENQLTELEAKLKVKKLPDLLKLKTAAAETQQEIRQLQESYYQKEERYRNTFTIYQKAEALYKKNQEQLEEISQLKQLSQTINGENSQKTSLERYILQSFLQEILDVANQQLLSLSHQRYQFRLNQAAGSYRSQTGLEISIYDDNFGAVRSAKTLSGGESFIASLALALALAEVIQTQAGGVAIEALFIDEGFGSLDEDALEMALEALETIENAGRIIGVISHVRQLKERIAQQVLVKTNGNGQSTIQYRV